MLKAASPTGPGLGLAEQHPASSARLGAPGGRGRAHPRNTPGTHCPNRPEAGPTSSSPGWPGYAGQQGRLMAGDRAVRSRSHTALHPLPRGPSTPPPTPASLPSSRTSGPTSNGAGRPACLRPAEPHTDLSGVPHAPRLRRPTSCRFLPEAEPGRAQKSRGGGGGKTRHDTTRGQQMGGGGQTENVMEVPQQQGKKSMRRGA